MIMEDKKHQKKEIPIHLVCVYVPPFPPAPSAPSPSSPVHLCASSPPPPAASSLRALQALGLQEKKLLNFTQRAQIIFK
jgi:hypothetical protein